ncbi:unnamed protein product [Prorocentrum cordatum]|uniref:NADP-dependent oxidoreductase domain-containing protein n=1 Tax=Prorocentrum cordatum TaxID=2364126 RepID=A0ABN9TAE2_9DINO|nr:unnamed protein product [Polarella glacialis]|mmetsp:Transcript_6561/g.17896  ORF Transcript_6561/g.17896 Transcript_6561/m.17896 type:complete len:292 (-) Transcript_6561:303-1178(-)
MGRWAPWSLLLGQLAQVLSQRHVRVPTAEVAPGVSMPVMSIGTGGLESRAATEIVSNWLSLGGEGIDTAKVYRDQDVVAKAIKDAGVDRKKLFITSKVPGCMNVRANVEDDLQQLGTDYIDLLLIHFPQPFFMCRDAWAVLEDFHSKGILRAIGVSNFKKTDLESLLKNATVVPAVNQIQHNVFHHDDETIAFARAHNITIEAYSPLGRSNSSEVTGSPVVRAVADNHNVTSFQVALRWILQHGHLLTFQSTSTAHQSVDADVFDFELTSEEMERLDQLQGPALAQQALVV